MGKAGIQKRPPGSTNLSSILGQSEQHAKAKEMMRTSSSHKKAEFIEIKGRPPAASIAIDEPTDSSETSDSEKEETPSP